MQKVKGQKVWRCWGLVAAGVRLRLFSSMVGSVLFHVAEVWAVQLVAAALAGSIRDGTSLMQRWLGFLRRLEGHAQWRCDARDGWAAAVSAMAEEGAAPLEPAVPAVGCFGVPERPQHAARSRTPSGTRLAEQSWAGWMGCWLWHWALLAACGTAGPLAAQRAAPSTAGTDTPHWGD